jgi:hypothetical protein
VTIQESRLTAIARRGLSLPAETREQVRKIGILCRPQVEIVYQQRANQWKLRGEESGGAVELLGHYVGFVDINGEGLPWLQRVKNFLPNGIHAVVIADELVRVEMFRYETTYHLLISKHWLQGKDKERPELKSAILFLGGNGSLDTELWSKDAAFRGGAMPHFYARSGELAPPGATWTNATLKITEAACCCGCRHCHLLEAGMSSSSASPSLSSFSSREKAAEQFECVAEGRPA